MHPSFCLAPALPAVVAHARGENWYQCAYPGDEVYSAEQIETARRVDANAWAWDAWVVSFSARVLAFAGASVTAPAPAQAIAPPIPGWGAAETLADALWLDESISMRADCYGVCE